MFASKGLFNLVPKIGLEIHIQLNSSKKLFSRSSNKFENGINTQVSLFDAGHPGILPVLNTEALKKAVKTVLCLKGEVQNISSFDRKHYHYYDLPLGYQITQQYRPIGLGGRILLDPLNPESKSVSIKQLQLEQDTGTFSKVDGHAYINLNRAGKPLLEIVTLPELSDASEASACLTSLQTLLRHIGVSEGNLEQGSLRVDVNVSLTDSEGKEGTRCELKNLHTPAIIELAIEAEIRRQTCLLNSNQKVRLETRGYNIDTDSTYLLRNKESGADYRFMPEPDLPPIRILQEQILKIKSSIKELPEETAQKLRGLGLTERTVKLLIADKNLRALFTRLSEQFDIEIVTNFMENQLVGQLNKAKHTVKIDERLGNELTQSLELIKNKVISAKSGKLIISKLIDGDTRTTKTIIQEEDLQMINDVNLIKQQVNTFIEANQSKWDKVLSGDKRSKAWFLGQIMAKNNFKVDSVLVLSLVDELISKAEH